MQRKGISEVVNIFRYNSPSKAYVKRLGGMPKYIKERPTEEPPVDYSKLKYLSKEDAPFAVSRTYPGNNLPVYTGTHFLGNVTIIDIRNAGSRHLVVIRRIEGDSKAMASELKKLFPTHKVEIHQGSIHVSGRVRTEVNNWLEKLGF